MPLDSFSLNFFFCLISGFWETRKENFTPENIGLVFSRSAENLLNQRKNRKLKFSFQNNSNSHLTVKKLFPFPLFFVISHFECPSPPQTVGVHRDIVIRSRATSTRKSLKQIYIYTVLKLTKKIPFFPWKIPLQLFLFFQKKFVRAL